MKLIIHWVVSALAILVTAYILPGVNVSGIVVALVLAVVLGAINAFIRPLLVMLTLPISVVTLGLFVLVIDALLIMLAGYVVPGFTVASFWWALAFGIVLAIVSYVLDMFTEKK
ncbi:MAG: phage holin family protein [Candidatus Paceibacterota bacterium]